MHINTAAALRSQGDGASNRRGLKNNLRLRHLFAGKQFVLHQMLIKQ